MAIEVISSAGPKSSARQVSTWHFIRLKFRILANSFRGRSWRMVFFVFGTAIALLFAAFGFFMLASPGLAGNDQFAMTTAGIGGGLLVFGWIFFPLVFFGVDETLDPARFALLPLPRRTLIKGLLIGAMIGVPALASLIISTGLVVTAGMLGGWLAAAIAAFGVVAGLILCVAASRAVTSAFANMLRSRRVRDLAAALLAVLAVSIGPLQIGAVRLLETADWNRLDAFSRIIGWTPLAASYTVGIDAAEGRWWTVPIKLSIAALTIVLLLAWWSRTLETAMVGSVSSKREQVHSEVLATPVGQLFSRALAWVSRDQLGALVAKEARYWWRDARRRSNLIALAVVGVFLPVMLNLGTRGAANGQSDFDVSPVSLSVSMIFVGTMAAITLANQFGFDGTAYATNIVAGVPGKVELRARMTAFSLYMGPILVAISVLITFLLSEPGWTGVAAGNIFAAYGVGLAANSMTSILGAFALPETSNPFALSSGAGIVRSLLTLVAMAITVAAVAPLVVAVALLGDVWLWLALPVGLAYGLGAAVLGAYIGGDVLDRRMPELLATITPRR